MRPARHAGGPLLRPFLLLAMALLPACGKGNGNSPSVVELSPREFSGQLQAKGDSVLLVDVRTPGEYRGGHLPGALSLDFQGAGFAAEVAKLPKDKQVFLYCRSGRRSRAAVPVFLKAGFSPIRHLEEGIVGWQAAALPVTEE